LLRLAKGGVVSETAGLPPDQFLTASSARSISREISATFFFDEEAM
jgi:hypothetical protein